MSAPLIAIAVAAAVALAIVAVLVLAARGPGLPSGRGARMAKLSRMAAGFWASWLGAALRRVFAGADRRQRIDAERRAADARRLADTMGHMKGAFMKLGQMISFISDDVPEEYRAMLNSLQASAPPMDFASLRDVVETELGKSLERAFADFDTRPIAAASIGQVHRAKLPTGEQVAVKIQYPGVAHAITADLDNVAILYRFVGMMYPKLDPRPVVEELRARIGEELDYRREAANQQGFADLYDGHPTIRIPRVFASHSTARVLTTEFVDGQRFATAEQLDQVARDRYGEILYRFVFGSTVRFRVFNGDPHPGNYLLDGDGRIVFLDFGLTKYFPSDMIVNWRRLVTAHLRGNRDEFRRYLVALSFVTEDSDLASSTLYDYFAYFYEPWQQDREFTFTREWNRRSFRMVFAPDGEFSGLSKKLNMPRDFVFVNRIQWGVMSILGTLQATRNWQRIHREYLFGEPPSTDMGEQIARWRARWLERRGAAADGKELYLSPDGIQLDDHRVLPTALSA